VLYASRKKRRRNFLIFLLISLYLFPSYYYGIRDYLYYRREVMKNKERLEKLSKDVKELRYIVNNLKSPYVIEKLAREKLFMVKPGEIPIIIIEKNNK
jgi:cell division protein FtsB